MKLLSALLSLLAVFLFHRPRSTFMAITFWTPKLISGAFAPLQALLGALIGLYGFFKRDWGLAAVGAANAALDAAHTADVARNRSQELFDSAFGAEWPMLIPPELKANFMPRPYQPVLAIPDDVIFQQNLVVGEKFAGGPLLADLWQPRAGAYRSGLAVLYTHGGAWRYGNKDMMTRPQFRRLAHQGHVILDIDYSITEDTPVQEMVRETKQALLWLKRHADAYGVDPQRIVLMGGSAGGHLALLTAYTPGHLAFSPTNISGDESVLGVVAFYPPVDFLQLYQHTVEQVSIHDEVSSWGLNPFNWALYGALKLLGFADHPGEVAPENNFLTRLLGGTPEQRPEAYRLLSPINHVTPTSPATFIIIGEHDFFRFNPGAHQLHFTLKSLGVPAAMLELPRTDHAFDIVLTQISPSAQAAIFHYERFLGILAGKTQGDGA
jgi:acetyl esterase/lipase